MDPDEIIRYHSVSSARFVRANYVSYPDTIHHPENAKLWISKPSFQVRYHDYKTKPFKQQGVLNEELVEPAQSARVLLCAGNFRTEPKV